MAKEWVLVRSLNSEPQFCHSLALWPWRAHFISPKLRFFICQVKMGMLTSPHTCITSVRYLVLATLGMAGTLISISLVRELMLREGAEWTQSDVGGEWQTQEQRPMNWTALSMQLGLPHPDASLTPRGCSGPAREVPGPVLSQLEAFRGLLHTDGNKHIFIPMFQSLAAKFWLFSAIGISGLNFSPSWETSVLLVEFFEFPSCCLRWEFHKAWMWQQWVHGGTACFGLE